MFYSLTKGRIEKISEYLKNNIYMVILNVLISIIELFIDNIIEIVEYKYNKYL